MLVVDFQTMGSLKLAMVVVFIPQKSANTPHQSIYFYPQEHHSGYFYWFYQGPQITFLSISFIGTQPHPLIYVLPMTAFALKSDLSSWDSDHMAYKPWNIYYMTHICLSIAVLNYAEWIFCLGKTDTCSKIVPFTSLPLFIKMIRSLP